MSWVGLLLGGWLGGLICEFVRFLVLGIVHQIKIKSLIKNPDSLPHHSPILKWIPSHPSNALSSIWCWPDKMSS